jgi:hypothetical protein
LRLDAPDDYDALLYSCITCNGVKSDRQVPDPLTTFIDGSIHVERDGTMRARSAEAAQLIELLDLNQPRKIEFRALWIELVALSQRQNPELYQRLMGFPADLPDLSRLRPPGGNSRPEGIAESYFARRRRGELPATY